MAYSSKNGRKPIELASKSNHSFIIRQPLVQAFLGSCNIPRSPDSKFVSLQCTPVAPSPENQIQVLIAVDGGYTECEVQEKYPSSSYAFYSFGGLLLETKSSSGNSRETVYRA